MLQEAKQEQESGSQTTQEEPEQGGAKVTIVAIVAIIAAIAKKMKIILEKHVFILQKAAVLSLFYQFVADSFVLFSLTQSHSVTICVPIAHPHSGEDRVLGLEM